MRRPLTALVLLLAFLAARPDAAGAHTDSSFVAVPAGGSATVVFAPTHGCADSPTVEVSVRAPVEGATAGPVDGWQQTATPDDEGNTILAWTGGVLPTDVTGAFPVTFTAPDTPGELLTFPAVQICENDEELAWIDGDPEGEYPAPRLLILPADVEPAATIADVPADAPGRDQLTAVADVDNPDHEHPPGEEHTEDTTTVPASDNSTTTTTAPATTVESDGDEEAAAPIDADATAAQDDSGGTSPLPFVVIGLAAMAVAAYMILRRRRTGSDAP
jgi:uncharacterized protein YcnI